MITEYPININSARSGTRGTHISRDFGEPAVKSEHKSDFCRRDSLGKRGSRIPRVRALSWRKMSRMACVSAFVWLTPGTETFNIKYQTFRVLGSEAAARRRSPRGEKKILAPRPSLSRVAFSSITRSVAREYFSDPGESCLYRDFRRTFVSKPPRCAYCM